MTRVDFYVLDGNDERERWRFACGVVDKAFESEQRVLVWLEDEAAVKRFDDLLWTFAQDSFVPHEPLTAESNWEDSPVLLSCTATPSPAPDVIVNLAISLPAGRAIAPQIIEIIDADAARRQAGRTRYRKYKEEGVEPTTHNVGATSS
jgi:DNA polymerase-3 subunit chi